MVDVWNWITTFFSGLSGFWTWLISPLNQDLLGDFAPIHIVTIGGVMVILVFWIIKLVNPLS